MGMGVFGESWLWCGCVVASGGGGVERERERQELLHNGRLHDKDRLSPDRAYHSQPCMPPM